MKVGFGFLEQYDGVKRASEECVVVHLAPLIGFGHLRAPFLIGSLNGRLLVKLSTAAAVVIVIVINIGIVPNIRRRRRCEIGDGRKDHCQLQKVRVAEAFGLKSMRIRSRDSCRADKELEYSGEERVVDRRCPKVGHATGHPIGQLPERRGHSGLRRVDRPLRNNRSDQSTQKAT